MNINQLDDRQIEILQIITEYINNNKTIPQFSSRTLYQFLSRERSDLNIRELTNLLEYLTLFGIGTYSHQKGLQIANRIPLNNLLKSGGIRGAIEKEKAKQQKAIERQSKSYELTDLQISKIKKEIESKITLHQTEFYQKSIDKLSKELDEKAIAIKKELQLTTIQKNKEQLWTIWLALIISFAALLVAIFK